MRTLPCLAFATLACTACSNLPPAGGVDAEFGRALNDAKAAQTLDPQAASRPRPPLQVDGAAARSAMELYDKSFQAPPPPATILNIGIGNNGAAPR